MLVKPLAEKCIINEGVGHVTKYYHHEGLAAAMENGCEQCQDNKKLVTTLCKPELKDGEVNKRFSTERCYMLFQNTKSFCELELTKGSDGMAFYDNKELDMAICELKLKEEQVITITITCCSLLLIRTGRRVSW